MLHFFFWSAIVLFVVAPREAYAYVDPGSGHFLLQLIAAAFVGSLFYLKKIWSFLRGPWKTRKSGAPAMPPTEQNPDEQKRSSARQ